MEQPQEASQIQVEEALRQAILRAEAAEVVRSNLVLAAWFQDFSDGLLARLDEVTLGDKESKLTISYLLWLVRQLKQSLEMAVTQGYDAKKDLDRLLGERKISVTEEVYER